MSRRGLREQATRFGLGYVSEPALGHEHYQGMLCIPYVRRTARGEVRVVGMKFRCILDHDHDGHGKYMYLSGEEPRLYNTEPLARPGRIVAVCEGELDAVALSACGVPAVGVPGATVWKDYFTDPFLGFDTVIVLADGDAPGLEFARGVARRLENARVSQFPPGEDANSYYVEHGADKLRERIGYVQL